MSDDGPAFSSAPPERIELRGGAALVRPSIQRTASAVAAINASLDHLGPWMAWATSPATEASIGTLFATMDQLWATRRDFPFSIVDAVTDEVIGGAGLHARLGPHGLEIGYWVRADRTGRGLATATAEGLTSAAFTIPEIERVRIQCAEDNVRSARVPTKLGFTLQGVVVPEDGPTEGRRTQRWIVERADWIERCARMPA
jgi:RimJ/RimL family protein N-acetyltransferase